MKRALSLLVSELRVVKAIAIRQLLQASTAFVTFHAFSLKLLLFVSSIRWYLLTFGVLVWYGMVLVLLAFSCWRTNISQTSFIDCSIALSEYHH